MGNLQEFDVDAWEEKVEKQDVELTLLGEGTFKCVIDASSVSETEKGMCMMLRVQVVESGQYMNCRNLMTMYIAKHRNEDYMRRCRQTFKTICTVVGIFNPNDTSAIEGKPFLCDITQRPDSNGKVWNEFKNFRKCSSKAEPEATPF